MRKSGDRGKLGQFKAKPMPLSIAHLGPAGTYAEEAALTYANWLAEETGQTAQLCPCPSIAQTLYSTAGGKTEIAVVPVENSIEGGVTFTLDTLWQLEGLQIRQALVLPISHRLCSLAPNLQQIKTVYSHPQALSQCQNWLDRNLPQAQLVPTPSTTDVLDRLKDDASLGAISSRRAAQLYNLPILASQIQDYPDNCTRFWVLWQGEAEPTPEAEHTHTSLVFSLPANAPGSLMQVLGIFSDRQINLSRIESRPSKRALGDYVFFVDLEVSDRPETVQSALAELAAHTDVLKILGSYRLRQI
jgi:prephenate dehydratase